MSIKHKESVESYVACHADLTASLENLSEFVRDLPAPTVNGVLPNLHYGHLGTLQQLRVHLADAMRMADAFCKDYVTETEKTAIISGGDTARRVGRNSYFSSYFSCYLTKK